MSSDSDSGWRAGFKTDYQTIFVEEWSPFVGAMLLVLTIIGLMLSGLVWGIRIENLVMNVPAESPEGDTFGEFLEFETLTLCPIDTRCLDRSLLDAGDIAWLNLYHAMVFERLAPRVSGDALHWLTERTRAL